MLNFLPAMHAPESRVWASPDIQKPHLPEDNRNPGHSGRRALRPAPTRRPRQPRSRRAICQLPCVARPLHAPAGLRGSAPTLAEWQDPRRFQHRLPEGKPLLKFSSQWKSHGSWRRLFHKLFRNRYLAVRCQITRRALLPLVIMNVKWLNNLSMCRNKWPKLPINCNIVCIVSFLFTKKRTLARSIITYCAFNRAFHHGELTISLYPS